PRLDALAREGTNLQGFYVNSPVCGPNRACLLTGRYPQNHGVRVNGVVLPESEVTLAHALRAAGYVTANLGKLHFLPHSGWNTPLDAKTASSGGPCPSSRDHP